MSLAKAVAEFLVAWDDELPRKQLKPFVAAMLDELTRKPGRPEKNELRVTVKQHILAGGKPAQIRRATGASYSLISSVRAEIESTKTT